MAGGWLRFFFLGLGVHLTLFLSIFDIYYQSPLLIGLPAHRPAGLGFTAPAKRLVLIVADGLRAETFYDDLEIYAPYFRSRITSDASWGVSLTHVPTESRPGHVAMAAGFYEDVSAVTKGWQENPVEFDSVFNRSSKAFCFGSPDIVPLFSKGANSAHVEGYTYTADFEDFASANASNLDSWVFDKVSELLRNASRRNNDSIPLQLTHDLNQPRLILFLHLLGLDTNGHGYKPHSNEYRDNVRVVDQGVEVLVSQLDEFYEHDGRTAYVFTADHGMTDWGSHGSGSDHETLTPIVAWGAGLKSGALKTAEDMKSRSWWLQSAERKDIRQVDLVPLMASLLNLELPTNSLGRLPLHYLHASARYRFQAAHANFRQIREQFLALRDDKQKRLLAGRKLIEFPSMTRERLRSVEESIDRLSEQQRYEIAAELCVNSLPDMIDGIMYYHRYERFSQGLAISATFVGWIVLMAAVSRQMRNHDQLDIVLQLHPSRSFICVAVVLCILITLNSMTWPNYIYYTLPLYLFDLSAYYYGLRWMRFDFEQIDLLMRSAQKLFAQQDVQRLASTITPLASSFALFFVALLYSQIFTHRWLLSSCLCALALLPVLNKEYQLQSPSLKLAWSMLCVLNALFPFLPTVGRTLVPWLYVVPSICLLLCHGVLWYTSQHNNDNQLINISRNAIQSPLRLLWSRDFAITVLVCLLVTIASDYQIKEKLGLPLFCQLISWLVLLICPLVAVSWSQPRPHDRFLTFAFALYLPYSQLSIAHEPFFYASFVGLLYVWLQIESAILGATQKLKTTQNGKDKAGNDANNPVWSARHVYVCQLLILTAFFGTGNMASLNSFDPRFLRCFVTVFRPWLMSVLLFVKILIPIFLVSMAVRACLPIISLPNQGVIAFAIKLMQLSDAMAMIFFLQLKDDGSWEDIGISISHYVVAMLMTVFFAALLVLSQWLCTIEASIIEIRNLRIFGYYLSLTREKLLVEQKKNCAV